MAISGIFSSGVLNVLGDALANGIVVSRNTAGVLAINDGAVTILGGTATVGNTAFIQVLASGGDDTVSLNETNGALPLGNLYGASGNDLMTGASRDDLLFGQSGNDTLFGLAGNDSLHGGSGDDLLVGGTGTDTLFGGGGNDRLIWNNGDDSDVFEGGAGFDTAEINGGGASETYTLTANGARMRFDRLSPAPFTLDIGTTEALVVNLGGGHDSFSAVGNIASLAGLTVDGGAGNDTIFGGNGSDLLLGGTGVDFIDGNQGNDTVFAGSSNDVIQWDPGDGNDVLEGEAGNDRMIFNGSNANENMSIFVSSGRAILTRDVANIVMDTNDVETFVINASGGTDTIRVGDLTGTEVSLLSINLAGFNGVDDGQTDTVVVDGTLGDDTIQVVSNGNVVRVLGLAATIEILGMGVGDRLIINALDGDDVVDATALTASVLTADGGAGDDVFLGGPANDIFFGGADDDVLFGGPGVDILDGGAGDNLIFQ